MIYGYWLWQRIKQTLSNDRALGTIEITLIICVLIALALMFKDTIVDFVEGILENISTQGSVFNPRDIAR